MVGKWIYHVDGDETFFGRIVSLIGETFIEVEYVYFDGNGDVAERPIGDPAHTSLVSLVTVADGTKGVFFDNAEAMCAWRRAWNHDGNSNVHKFEVVK